jgi:hypothetical protein
MFHFVVVVVLATKVRNIFLFSKFIREKSISGQKGVEGSKVVFDLEGDRRR